MRLDRRAGSLLEQCPRLDRLVLLLLTLGATLTAYRGVRGPFT